MENSDKKIRIGVIGYGAMGKNHLSKYLKMPNVEVVGVSDPDKEVFEKKFKIPIYSDYKELLNQVDGVSIVVPTILHKEVAIDCCDKGVHCLVEKPITFTTLEAMKLVEVVKHNNIKLLVGHVENFNPGVQMVKEMLNNKMVSNIVTVHSTRMSPPREVSSDVGVITDLGVHDFGVIRYLFGKSMTNIVSRHRSIRGGKEDIAIILGNIDKIPVLIETNWISPSKIRELKINGYVGSITLNYMTQQIKLCYNGAMSTEDYSVPIVVKYQEPLKLELNHFIDCIKNDTKPLIDAEEGMEILRMAEEALE